MLNPASMWTSARALGTTYLPLAVMVMPVQAACRPTVGILSRLMGRAGGVIDGAA
jgi:hypothetical protein